VLIANKRDLAMIATRLSVWSTARGIGAVPVLPEDQHLSVRQYRIARLACSNMTNLEIADELGISINTVKQRLKQIFERLGVDGRNELATVLCPFVPLEGIPIGVSHRDGLAISRATHAATWVG
jgi:DNA-binding CsgD family transcriptional regulator